MTERIYRMSAKRGRVAVAGAPPRQPTLQAGWVSWDIPETELSDIPVLREWFHAHRVRGVEESGFVSRTESLPSDGEPYSIIAIPWTPWRGPVLTQSVPCAGCGLNIATATPPAKTVAAELIDNVLDALAEAPLCFLPAPMCLVASRALVESLRSRALDDGLVAHPLDDAGQALLLWSDSALGGPAYPYGPQPCAVCGRAKRRVGDRIEFVRPKYAYELSFEADITHWTWSTIYSQTEPLVSHAVAELLLDIMPGLNFTPHGRPDAPGAFLPERFQ